jgi:hypothetical protein
MNFPYIPLALLILILMPFFIIYLRKMKIYIGKHSGNIMLKTPDTGDEQIIKPPRTILLAMVLYLWSYMLFLWLIIYNVSIFLIILLWLFLLIVWNHMNKIWSAYSYSKLILNAVTVIVNIMFFGLASLIYYN